MLDVRLLRKQSTAPDICAFELVDPRGLPLPAFTPGAHIDVHLAPGLVRQYSICSSPAEREHYVLGVLLQPDSTGGSRAMHALAEGALIRIGEPRNHFGLEPRARHSVLVAGGIGITPLLCMAEYLLAGGASFELHYCVRSAERAAFRSRLDRDDLRPHVSIHSDDDASTRFDPARQLAARAEGGHLYVCGPAGFIAWIFAAASACGWAPGQLHREYFASESGSSADAPFQLKLARSGTVIDVRADQSALQALREQRIDIDASCEQGICGMCATRVLEGMPEHRDLCLSAEQHAANDCFTPCCSRARTPALVIDL